ncbi:MAG: HAMP domain-containing histidine kinase [Clostridiales bacterium]|nr:HAMP domain-containing histidine kinase [Clostridiales bacterium]
MISKIRSRLSVKVFLITFFVQIVFGSLIIGLLYKATPQSYSDARKDEVQSAFEELIGKLEKTTTFYGVSLIDDFARENGAEVILYKGDGFWDGLTICPMHSKLAVDSNDKLEEMKEKHVDDYCYTDIRAFSFADKKTTYYSLEYALYVGRSNPVKTAVEKCIPLILLIVLFVSLICACIYTFLFARPVKKLSDVSRSMSKMDFSRKCSSGRKDEIGALANDLDEMSSKLSDTFGKLEQRTSELEEEIRRVNELEAQKDVFFAAASHELKTPVTVLEGQIRGMIEGVGPYADHDAYLPRTLGTVKRMESLINEILTVSRMQSGNEIATTRVDMVQLLEEKMEEYEELFQSRGLKMQLQFEQDLIFVGNRDLTSMAIGAFLSNAAFYSEEGSIVYVDGEKRTDASNAMVAVTIRNNGHIDEDDLVHLFEPFYRADKSRSRRSGGSGLGLYLAKLIVEKQGGSCSLKNDGEDVVATIHLPHVSE